MTSTAFKHLSRYLSLLRCFQYAQVAQKSCQRVEQCGAVLVGSEAAAEGLSLESIQPAATGTCQQGMKRAGELSEDHADLERPAMVRRCSPGARSREYAEGRNSTEITSHEKPAADSNANLGAGIVFVDGAGVLPVCCSAPTCVLCAGRSAVFVCQSQISRRGIVCFARPAVVVEDACI